MCLTCGCSQPYSDHGDFRHITATDIRRAAQAAGISVAEAVQNLVDTAKQLPNDQRTKTPATEDDDD